METKWEILETDANIQLMTQVLGISAACAVVIANRGYRSKKAALAYMHPKLCENTVLDDMKDVRKLFERLTRAVNDSEKIMIYGDYDVDGVMSAVILYKALKLYGALVDIYIPNREEEGYGLNVEAVKSIKKKGYKVILTADNGISAINEVDTANSLGMDVLIIDHHEPGFTDDEARQDIIPPAFAVVDPKQQACPYPFKSMCAAALCYKLSEAFYAYQNKDFSPLNQEFLALSAIASICDIVDLTGENRALVKEGLRALNNNKRLNTGLAKLISLKGYPDKEIDTFTVGFILGPCINATGRLESAEMSVKLFLTNDTHEQERLAQSLSDLNETRKSLTRNCVDRVLNRISENNDKVLVLVDKETHESIAGIVAGRIKETLCRPAIVLTKSSEEGVLKGSGRSISSYNMFEALFAQKDLFIRFGGHSMAAGLTLEEGKAEDLRQRLNSDCTLTTEDLRPIIQVDKELSIEEITLDLAKTLSYLGPFGKANHEPLFVSMGMLVSALRDIKEKNTLIFTYESGGKKLKGIAFGLNEKFHKALGDIFDEAACKQILSGKVLNTGLCMDLVYNVEANTFNGITSVQIRIRDFRLRRLS